MHPGSNCRKRKRFRVSLMECGQPETIIKLGCCTPLDSPPVILFLIFCIIIIILHNIILLYTKQSLCYTIHTHTHTKQKLTHGISRVVLAVSALLKRAQILVLSSTETGNIAQNKSRSVTVPRLALIHGTTFSHTLTFSKHSHLLLSRSHLTGLIFRIVDLTRLNLRTVVLRLLNFRTVDRATTQLHLLLWMGCCNACVVLVCGYFVKSG